MFKIKAEKFKEMVSRAIKGAGNNKLLPITQMMRIALEDHKLIMVTTDVTNYLYIIEDKVEGEDFEIVVDANQIYKLVSKLTCDSISLTVSEASVDIKGNGNYKLPLQFDETGEMVKFPNPLESDIKGNETEITRSEVGLILTMLKPALSTIVDEGCYTGYYFGDIAIASNGELINVLNIDLLKKVRLVRADAIDLLAVMESEKIIAEIGDDTIIFKSPDCMVYSRIQDGIEDYAVDSIKEYLEPEALSECVVDKSSMVALLERLQLFVSSYEDGDIRLTFMEDGIQVSSLSSNGVEVIPYLESQDFQTFTCRIHVDMLLTQVKSHADTVKICYGNSSIMKLVSGNVTQIIALSEDSNEE